MRNMPTANATFDPLQSLKNWVLWWGPPILLLAVLVTIWETSVWQWKIPAYLLPAPSQVGRVAWLNRLILLKALGITGGAAFAGFLASLGIGFVVSLIFSQSEWIRRACYPYAIFLQTVPIVAIAPLIILWFGYGFQSVVVVSFMISLFPIITNGTAGLMRVDAGLLELFRLYRATAWQRLWKLRVPNAVPDFVTGAKTSSGLAVIGAIVGEFFVGFGSQAHGLGYYVILTSGQSKTDLLFASMFLCTTLGLLVFAGVNWVSSRVLKRWQTGNSGQ